MTNRYCRQWLGVAALAAVTSLNVSAQERGSSVLASAPFAGAPDRGELVLSHVDPDTDDQIINTATPGGYVWGTNGYGDLGKYSCYDLPAGETSITIERIDAYMIRSIEAQLVEYDIVIYSGGPGYDGEPNAGPQAELYREAFPMEGIEPTDPTNLPIGPTSHPLSTTLTVEDSFCVGVEWAEFAGMEDLVVAGTEDRGVGEDNPYQWEQWSDFAFYNMSEAWGEFSADMWVDVYYALTSSNEPDALPSGLVLSNVYPNPFSSRATVELSTARSERVSVQVFDVLGRWVATVFEGVLAPGARAFDLSAQGLKAGTYVVRIQGESFMHSEPVAVIR